LWFTGEIHIVDKNIKPTTDRADFTDNEPRRHLYAAGAKRVAKHLNLFAQDISNTRKANDDAEKWQRKFSELDERLTNGGIERADLKPRQDELHRALQALDKRKCKDKDIQALVKQVTQQGRELQRRLETAKTKDRGAEISDLAHELKMTAHARRVYTIIMETLKHYFSDDKDTYYEISTAVSKALKKRY
jgi:hypothetical protein